jgi:hypothetical protein
MIRNKPSRPISLTKKNPFDLSITLLIIIEQEEKLSKTILIIILPKLILDNYPGVIILLIPSSFLVLNTPTNITNRTKDSMILIILIELFILSPSITF